ncbi:MAG: hypothetical protein M1821_003812 [Bathelium mastoideum]|nr:MAG: hypothetical protein M1821_003812 [Bathelium mastoideum]
MLNPAKLSELLNHNVDPKLYPRIFVMTPNATLMAYTTPADIRELRDQATLVSMCWKDSANVVKHKVHPVDAEAESSDSLQLETLTIEFDSANVIVRSLQERLLLVLVGGVPPNRQHNFKATPERNGDPRYPSTELKEESTGAVEERASSSVPETSTQDLKVATSSSLPSGSAEIEMTEKEKDIRLGVLHIQRKKADALVAYIKGEFDKTNFVMPDDVANPFG